MDHEINQYLNDHVGGSCGAILLIQHIADRMEQPRDQSYFLQLKELVQQDRILLQEMIDSIGKENSTVSKVAGKIAARVGSLKLMWEGLKPGELGIFEALELLCLGIQGKRLLWIAMQEVEEHFPEWEKYDFKILESEAVRQRDGVEQFRVTAARACLADSERQGITIL